MSLDNAALAEPSPNLPAPQPAGGVVDLTAPAPGSGALLDPGFDLTLRPMRYPQFYDMYRDAIRNTWTVEEIDFSDDLVDLQRKLLPAERHLINRLVAFFATGDSIVANNLVLNLYKHINAPEGADVPVAASSTRRPLHVQFYLTLLDTYIPDARPSGPRPSPRSRTSRPSGPRREFCFKWIDSINDLRRAAHP